MTVEQKKKDLEEMLNFYSKRAAHFTKENKPLYAEIHRDRVRQIQEVLEVLGYKTRSICNTPYTCYEIYSLVMYKLENKY